MRDTALLLLAALLLLQSCGGKSASSTETSTNAATGTPADVPENEKPAVKGRYQAGDALYCYARSGLVLREEAAQTGAKLGSVAMYDKVEVIDDAPFTTAFQTKESCGLQVPGHWVKVRHKGKEGWLFDGYLLAFPPKVETSDADYWTQQSKVKSSDTKAPEGREGLYDYTNITFENGVHYIMEAGEGGATHVTTLPKSMANLSQAYLFAIADDPSSAYRQEWKCKCGAKIECENKEGYGFITVETDKGGDFVITSSWAD